VAELVTTERHGDHVVLVTIRRPDKRNALSIEVRDRLSDELDRCADDEGTHVVVLTGEGDVFSAGFDLSEFETAMSDQHLSERLWASSDRYHRRVITLPIPTVAAVNGPAIAGGFDLAVMCDVRVAATTATFSHPERTFGPVVYGPLHELVGGSLARDLCLTGRRLTADEALTAGLVSEVVDPERVLDAALEVAARTALAPRQLLADTKAKILRRAGIDPEAGTLDL
jgi:enoyl-CoA hydratase